MDNIYEALKESHETQRKLYQQLVRIKSADLRARSWATGRRAASRESTGNLLRMRRVVAG